MSDAIATMGTTFFQDAAAVINLTNVAFSGFSQGEMETTNLSSAGGIQTYAPSGVVNRGTLSIDFNYDPSAASHVAIVTAIRTAAAAATYIVTYANADTFTGELFPLSFEQTNTLGPDGKLEGSATFRIDGTGITDPS